MSAASLCTAVDASGTLLLVGLDTRVVLLRLSQHDDTCAKNDRAATTAAAAATSACAQQAADGVDVLATITDTAPVRAVAFVCLTSCRRRQCNDSSSAHDDDSDRDLYVVYAGDGKRVCFCRVNATMTQTQQQQQQLCMPQLTPSCVYGPHKKRITQLAAHSCADNNNNNNNDTDSNGNDGDEAVVYFADKFGEVYRLLLRRDNMTGDEHVTAVFALQHFGVLTCMTLLPQASVATTTTTMSAIACYNNNNDNSSSSCCVSQPARCAQTPRWLVTCDKDAHVRVSDYPATYTIAQYLWPPLASDTHTATTTSTTSTATAAVTCVADMWLPSPSPSCGAQRYTIGSARGSGDECVATVAVDAADVAALQCSSSVGSASSGYVCFTGDCHGVVHVWSAAHTNRNNNSNSNNDSAFTHVCTLVAGAPCASTSADASSSLSSLGPVVGIACCTLDASARAARHARTTVGVVLVAYEHSRTVYTAVVQRADTCSSSSNDSNNDNDATAAVVALLPAVTLDTPPLALLRARDAHTATVLQRSGAVTYVRVASDNDDDNGSNSHATTTATTVADATTATAAAAASVVVTATTVGGFSLAHVLSSTPLRDATAVAALLSTLDMCASWRYDVHDPRTKQHAHRSSNRKSDNDDNDDDDDDGDSDEDGGDVTSRLRKKARAD